MAYDLQKKSLGVYDTAYEAAVARARIMGIPAPEKLSTDEPPPPAKKVDAMAVAVRQWYESKWTAVESWQTGSIAQKEAARPLLHADGRPTRPPERALLRHDVEDVLRG